MFLKLYGCLHSVGLVDIRDKIQIYTRKDIHLCLIQKRKMGRKIVYRGTNAQGNDYVVYDDGSYWYGILVWITMMGLRLPMMVTDMNILPTKMVMMDIITTPIQMNMALDDNIVVRILDIDDTKDDDHKLWLITIWLIISFGTWTPDMTNELPYPKNRPFSGPPIL